MTFSRRWFWLVALIPMGCGLARLRFNVEVLDLLPADVPAVQGLKIYQENFANARELIITVQAPTAEAADAAARRIAQTLSQRTDLIASVTWQPPWLEHPAQAAEFIAYLWLNQPPEIFGQLTNRLAAPNLSNALDTAREQLTTSMSPTEIAQLSYDPLGLTHLPPGSAPAPIFNDGQELFASNDGTFRLVFVEASEDLSSYRRCLAWLKEVKGLVESRLSRHGLTDEVVLHYTGRPAFVAEIAGGMEHDITRSVGGTVIIIVALFWWAHRRWRPLLWILALLALILGTTLTLGGLFFGTLNVVSVGFAAILLGLAVDYGLVLYQESVCAPHLSAGDVRRLLAPAIIWSAVTTAGAFLILNFGGLPGLAQLGSLVAIGITLAAVVMLNLFLPPLLPSDRSTIQSTRLSMNRPTPDPSQEGSRHSAASRPFPSREGSRHSTASRPFPSWERLGVGSWSQWMRESVRRLSTIGRSIGHSTGLFSTVTAVALLGIVAVLFNGCPALDHTANSLRPRHSSAYATLEEIKVRLSRTQEPFWLLIGGRNEDQVARRLDAIQPILQRAASEQQIRAFTLPTGLWPRPEFQSLNRIAARQLEAERAAVRAAAQAHGFAGNALAFTDSLLNAWRQATVTAGVFWPTNEMSRWILEKLIARTPTNFYALGLIYPATNSLSGSAPLYAVPVPSSAGLSALAAQLPRDHIWLAGWEVLGSALLEVVKGDFWRVMLPMTVLLLGSLWLAFRRFTEILLSLATLGFSLLCLLALMKLAGWSWNLLNLLALPLLLGAGVDYSIHMQLALRRHGGDIAQARRRVGRALFLCAATTVAGFGSNVWSSNGGLVSLGQVCAAGIAFAYLTSNFLLPLWWKTFAGDTGIIAATSPSAAPRDGVSSFPPQDPFDEPNAAPPGFGLRQSSGAFISGPRARKRQRTAAVQDASAPAAASSHFMVPTHVPTRHHALPQPSPLYRSELWQLGLVAARNLSPDTCLRLSQMLAKVYWCLALGRRQAVIQNLLPALKDNRTAAGEVSARLVQNFAAKLADLWRYESGQAIDGMFAELTGWEHFTAAQATGRGVLLLTPHLGNWEFGAPLLARRGVKLLVITLAEPQERLTEIRRAARARWGIETLVISHNPFAFVEIIRRLESGAIIALLVDRPTAASAAMVELFGRRFPASIAPAELARAAGCVLLPVYLPRTSRGYAAHILPAIAYDRAALRSREARHNLSQEIMRVFEPAIRQHLDQWYHFVSIWP